MKRLFSFLLAMCLVLSLLPVGTLAAQDSALAGTKFLEVTQLTADKSYVLGAVNADGTVSAIRARSSSVSAVTLNVTDGSPASVTAEDSALVWRYTSGGVFSGEGGYLYPSSSGSVQVYSSTRTILYADGRLSFESSMYGTMYLTFDGSSFGATQNAEDAAAFRLFEGIDPAACAHETLTMVDARDAACTESGNTLYWQCGECGAVFSDAEGGTMIDAADTVLPALGHDWGEWTVATPATETETGVEQRVCARCGAAETRTIPFTGTRYVLIVSNGVAMTANRSGNTYTTTGSYEYSGLDGVPYTDGMTLTHSMVWELRDQGNGYSISHDGQNLVGEYRDLSLSESGSDLWTFSGSNLQSTNATSGNSRSLYLAYESGGDLFTVRSSGSSVTLVDVEPVAPCTHDANELQGQRDASCTENGYTGDTVCTVCGEIHTLGQTIPALGHDWGEWAVTTAATETEYGLEQRVCARCGEEETRTIPFTGTKHFLIVSNGVALTADRSENTLNNSGSYYYGGLDGVPYTEGMKPTHGMIWALTVSGDGYVITHDGKNLVGYYYGSSSQTGLNGNLDLSDADTDVWTLSGDQLRSSNAGGRYLTYESSADLFTIRSSGNSVTLVALATPCAHNSNELQGQKDASCDEDGYTGDWVCTVCGAVHEQGEIIPASHDWGEWVVTRERTDADPGEQMRSCARCGATETSPASIAYEVAVTPSTGNPSESATIHVGDTLNIRVTNGSSGSAYNYTVTLNSGAAELQGDAAMNIAAGGEGVFSVKGVAEGSADITIQNDSSYSTRRAVIHLTVVSYGPAAPTIVDSGVCGENVTWTLDSDGLLTISGTGPMKDYEVSDDVPWNANRESVLSVVIADGVTSVGTRAFLRCKNMESVTIPDSVTSIGDYVFTYCTSLASVTIPDSITSIGNAEFEYCYSLTSLTIPNSVTSIGNYAFEGCNNLTSLTIPDSVTSIGDFAFCGCISLPEILVEECNSSYCSIDGVLFNLEQDTLICCPGGKTGVYTIPDSVTRIEDFAFAYCSSLTSVIIPDSVTSLGRYAFEYSSGLTSVVISNGIINISEKTFQYCFNLTTVTIPEGVTNIGNSAFYNCISLTTVTIPESVTSIGECAFNSCTSLTDVWYGGTQEQWDRVSIGEYNDPLRNAVIHFDSAACTHPETECRNAVEPTCSEPGYTGDTVCLICGAILQAGEVIPATPHTWSAWATVIPATESETGMEVRVCRVCRAIETRDIPKLCPFNDVPTSAYYYDSVLWAYDHEPQITSGYSDGGFRPDQVCTRAQVVTFLWRAAGEPEPKLKVNPFRDVSASAYYYKAVLWAVENGVTTGNSGGTFNPNGECTRAQVVTFLWRAAGEPEPTSTTNPFQDVSSSAYYYQAVLWALENGITTGNTSTTFNPTGKCTRAHVVTFLYRAQA